LALADHPAWALFSVEGDAGKCQSSMTGALAFELAKDKQCRQERSLKRRWIGACRSTISSPNLDLSN
jgi:hypothetical protein